MVPVRNRHEDQVVLLSNSNLRLNKVLSASLRTLGINVQTASDPDEIEGIVKHISPSLFLADLDGKISPLQLRETIYQHPDAKLILLLSERLDDQVRVQLEPDQVIYKPFDTRFVCRMVMDLLSSL